MSNNSEQYHFADFTLSNYRKLIRLSKKRFHFVSYPDFKPEDKNQVLWRHDVDVSMQAAAKLAIIEQEEGIKSTYFLLLHSEFYNLLEIEVFKLVKEIISRGHDIGLHFYAKFYKITNEIQLEKYLQIEQTFLESILECRIKTFSFHNPEAFELSCKASSYAGMLNTYAASYQQDIGYCSDSNGHWRHTRLETFLTDNTHKSIQVLTHPEWWTENIMSPKEKIEMCIKDRAEKVYEDYVELLGRYNRQNIDW